MFNSATDVHCLLFISERATNLKYCACSAEKVTFFSDWSVPNVPELTSFQLVPSKLKYSLYSFTVPLTPRFTMERLSCLGRYLNPVTVYSFPY